MLTLSKDLSDSSKEETIGWACNESSRRWGLCIVSAFLPAKLAKADRTKTKMKHHYTGQLKCTVHWFRYSTRICKRLIWKELGCSCFSWSDRVSFCLDAFVLYPIRGCCLLILHNIQTANTYELLLVQTSGYVLLLLNFFVLLPCVKSCLNIMRVVSVQIFLPVIGRYNFILFHKFHSCCQQIDHVFRCVW